MIRFIIWVILLVDVLVFTGCSGGFWRIWAHETPPVLGPPSPPPGIPPQDVETIWLLRVNMLVACVSVLATPLCMATAIWLRSTMFATLAVASVGVLITTMATSWVLHHTAAMLWVVGGVVVLAVGGLAWHLWRNRAGLFGAIRVAEALKPPREMEQAKAARKAVQIVAAGKASKVIDEARVRLGLSEPIPTNDPRNT